MNGKEFFRTFFRKKEKYGKEPNENKDTKDMKFCEGD